MAYTYTISWSTAATGPWTQAATGLAATTDTVTGLSSSTNYYIQVIATDSVTGLASAAVVNGPFTTASAGPVESPNGTTVNAIGQQILSSQTPGSPAPAGGPFDTWGITAVGGEIIHNGTADTNTGNILELYYLNHFLYQEANATNELGINPGWWQYTGGTTGNGFGYTACTDPIPAGPTIFIATIASQNTNTPFTVSGTLSGYAAAPTLQYQDNQTGAWINLPTGFSVTLTTFSFTHPAVSSPNAAMTVGVRDANQNSIVALSNAFTVSTPGVTTLESIALSGGGSFSAGVANTLVGAITVSTVPAGLFTGVLSLTGANASSFTIPAGTSNLQTQGALAANTYNLNIVATQSGASGSPLTQAETLIGQSGPATGPAASGSFINVDFTNTTGQTVYPQLFGAASSGISNGGFSAVTNATFQQKVRALNLPLFRLHGDTWSTPSNLSTFIANLSNLFPSTCTLVVGVDNPANGQAISAAFASSAIPAPLYEYGNETNLGDPGNTGGNTSAQSQSSYNSGFVTLATNVQKTNATYKAAGNVGASTGGSNTIQGMLASGSGITAANLGLYSIHQYTYCASSGNKPSDLQCAQGLNGSGGNAQLQVLQTIQGWAAASSAPSGATSIPMLMGEYNIECSADSDNRAGSILGACFLASTLMSCAAGISNTHQVWGAIWDLCQDPGDNYNLIDSSFNTYPQYYMMQQMIATMPGAMVNVSNVSGNPSGSTLNAWATKNGVHFGVLIVNSNTGTATGQVALSHWPVNSQGTATMNVWQYTGSGETVFSNRGGTTSTIPVTAGIVASMSYPGQSVTILSL